MDGVGSQLIRTSKSKELVEYREGEKDKGAQNGVKEGIVESGPGMCSENGTTFSEGILERKVR